MYNTKQQAAQICNRFTRRVGRALQRIANAKNIGADEFDLDELASPKFQKSFSN